MTELPTPRVRTEKLIALADEVANRPLPLQTRILLPAILTIIGIGAFWFGFRDDGSGNDPEPGPSSPSTTSILTDSATSVVFTAPP